MNDTCFHALLESGTHKTINAFIKINKFDALWPMLWNLKLALLLAALPFDTLTKI
jgi:hypothetical protein